MSHDYEIVRNADCIEVIADLTKLIVAPNLDDAITHVDGCDGASDEIGHMFYSLITFQVYTKSPLITRGNLSLNVLERCGNIKSLASLANNVIAIARVTPGSGVGGWKCLLDKFNAIERVRLENHWRSGGVRLALLNQTLKLMDSQPKIAVTLRARNLDALGHRAVIVHIIELEPGDEI